MTRKELQKAFVERTWDPYFAAIANTYLIKHPTLQIDPEPHFKVWLGYELAVESQYLPERLVV